MYENERMLQNQARNGTVVLFRSFPFYSVQSVLEVGTEEREIRSDLRNGGMEDRSSVPTSGTVDCSSIPTSGTENNSSSTTSRKFFYFVDLHLFFPFFSVLFPFFSVNFTKIYWKERIKNGKEIFPLLFRSFSILFSDGGLFIHSDLRNGEQFIQYDIRKIFFLLTFTYFSPSFLFFFRSFQ